MNRLHANIACMFVFTQRSYLYTNNGTQIKIREC